MTKVIGAPRSRRRRWTFMWCLIVALGIGMVFISGAAAVHDLQFELDGNTTTQGSTAFHTGTFDWNSFFDSSGAKAPVLPDATRPGFTASTFVKDFSTTTKGGNIVFDTSDSSTYTTGSKDIDNISSWACTPANNVTDKGDIQNAYAVAYTDPNIDPDTGKHDQILYFALERNSNTGDANVAFWFLQGDASCSGSANWTGNHQDGDILVVSAFTKGGSVPGIDAYRWNGGANGSLGTVPVAHGQDCTTNSTPAGDKTCATSNTAPITTLWQTDNKTDGVGTKLQTGEFFEGGLNLTKSDLGGKCFNTFVGDTRSSQSLTATLYDFARGVLGECKSTTVTTPSITADTIIPASGTLSVADDATVTVDGVSSFSGTVTWHLCGPFAAGTSTLCGTGGVAAGSQPVTATPTTVTSDSKTITEAGRYCWRADFSGDTAVGVPPSSDSRASECFLITPRQPTLVTQATTGPVDFGQKISDVATIGNTANEQGTLGPTGSTDGSIDPTVAGSKAKGTVSLTVFGPDSCSTTAYTATAINVNGDGNYGGAGTSFEFQPSSPGQYVFVASYSGDLPNTKGVAATACADQPSTEKVLVRQIPTTIKTRQSWIPNDTATISATTGNLAAGGTVAFSLYSNATCSGTALYSESTTLVGGNPTEEVGTSNTTSFKITTGYTDTVPTTTGKYSWKVVYTPAAGDTAHTGKQSACDAEHFTITYTNDPGPGTNLP